MNSKKRKVKIGLVGIGRRGFVMLQQVYTQMSDVEIVTLCDSNPDHLENGRKLLEELNYPIPILTANYDDVINNPDVEAVILTAGWRNRVPMAIKAMLAGKYTALEVGCAYTLEECWDLVDTYEETGVPVMMLENCCYGRAEMMTYHVAEQGLFGEIVHCEGAYRHYLVPNELFHDANPETGELDHYRLADYETRNCHQYPTHELGPISKVLKINRGNRFKTICSFASKNVGIKDYAERTFGKDSVFAKREYKQADIMTSIMTTEEGQTVSFCLDTTIPRAYYSRDYTVRGTRGMYTDHKRVLFFDHMKESIRHYNNLEEMHLTYGHPLHQEIDDLDLYLGPHANGMDWLVTRAFLEAVKTGTNTPIDVYDTALWLSIAPLSQISLEKGSVPIEVPDFTRGKWKSREPIVEGKYCLDKVCVDKKVKIVP